MCDNLLSVDKAEVLSLLTSALDNDDSPIR